MSGAKIVNQGDLIAAAQKRNPSKVSPDSWITLSKYYIGFLDEGLTELVEDLPYFHSACVDPRELSVSLKYCKLVASEPAFKACPQLRHYLATSQYTKDKAMPSTTGPATAQLLEPLAMASWAKKADLAHGVGAHDPGDKSCAPADLGLHLGTKGRSSGDDRAR